MTAMTFAVRDSMTMLRRHLRHIVRYPSVILFMIGIPVVLMLLFLYVFGGTLGAGLGLGASAGRSEYANYLAPGIILLTVAGAGTAAAISVVTDMSEGIIARFKTMAISQSSVLTGHVLGTVLQTAIAVAVVICVTLLVGFRPNANPVEWVAAIALLLMVTLAFTWLCVTCGLMAKGIETASNLPMLLMLLPLLGSGFAPTDSMPAALHWFADHQPFTPFIETLRGLLLGSGIGNQAIVSAIWVVALTVFGYLVSRALYKREPSR
jgi:ABC-2 type transport system permease protein